MRVWRLLAPRLWKAVPKAFPVCELVVVPCEINEAIPLVFTAPKASGSENLVFALTHGIERADVFDEFALVVEFLISTHLQIVRDIEAAIDRIM